MSSSAVDIRKARYQYVTTMEKFVRFEKKKEMIYRKNCFFSAGICGCTEDVKLCLVGMCCGCYIHALNNEQVNNEDKVKSACLYMCLGGCPCLYAAPHRGEFRKKYDLVEEPNDCLATWCCGACATCQERRELNQRSK